MPTKPHRRVPARNPKRKFKTSVVDLKNANHSSQVKKSLKRVQSPGQASIRPPLQTVAQAPAPPPPPAPLPSQSKPQTPIKVKKVSQYSQITLASRQVKFKQNILKASSPSQLSLRTITEHYELPSKSFQTAEDVFKFRGYKKLGKIDEGAFGIVSKAVRLNDKFVVAMKEVDLRKKRAKRVEEMKRELFVLQKIDHLNVVSLVEHFIIGQTLVIVMEFCAGGNLTTYLKETPIGEEEARFLFKQMAISIKVLHRKGIAHRDIKLNNFLLDSNRKIVKIADFGLSVVSFKQADGILMAKTYCGTEPYMAPELLKRNSYGLRSYNPIYSDIWSLGICLFAMLTRTFPFKMHTTQQNLFKAQMMRKWRFPRRLREILSEEIKDLAWHMLDPEAERRITINGVVAHPWLNNNQLLVLSYDESETSTVVGEMNQKTR